MTSLEISRCQAICIRYKMNIRSSVFFIWFAFSKSVFMDDFLSISLQQTCTHRANLSQSYLRHYHFGCYQSYAPYFDVRDNLFCSFLSLRFQKAMLSEDRSEPFKGRRNPQFLSKNVFTLSPEAVKSLRFERKKRKFKLPPVFPIPKFKL